MKKRSSKWIKTKGARYAKFYWQEGYAFFSTDPRKLDAIARYIIGQREHHQRRSFQDECRKFFKEFRVEYDERYVWD